MASNNEEKPKSFQVGFGLKRIQNFRKIYKKAFLGLLVLLLIGLPVASATFYQWFQAT